jgi:phosphonate transport system substrate-binding protein
MKKALYSSLLAILLPLAACSPQPKQTANSFDSIPPLQIGAIPDQDPQKLQRQYEKLAAYLQKELGVPVKYKPVTDYAAAVTAFKVGDCR